MDNPVDALTVTVTARADDLLVALSGELDEDSAGGVRALDIAAARTASCRRLTLDLGGLTFLDSSGIGALVGLRNQAAALDMTTGVLAAPAHIRHTFAVAGLSALFGVQP